VDLAVSFVLLAIGAALAIAVDPPRAGPNLQTLGLALMLVALTAINVMIVMRPRKGVQSERRSSRG